MENIKRVSSRIWVDDYKITFEYDTLRKNHKKQTRIVTSTSEETAKRDLIFWLDIMREKEPQRKMLNANILSIEKLNGRYILINEKGKCVEE